MQEIASQKVKCTEKTQHKFFLFCFRVFMCFLLVLVRMLMDFNWVKYSTEQKQRKKKTVVAIDVGRSLDDVVWFCSVLYHAIPYDTKPTQNLHFPVQLSNSGAAESCNFLIKRESSSEHSQRNQAKSAAVLLNNQLILFLLLMS